MPIGKIRIMNDDRSWIGLEPWERLRWARLRWQRDNGGAQTIRSAAASIGINENTYSAYERRPGTSKTIALDHQAAAKIAKKFKVRWEWLLTGQGPPWPDEAQDERLQEMNDKVRQLAPGERKIALDTALSVIDSFIRRAK